MFSILMSVVDISEQSDCMKSDHMQFDPLECYVRQLNCIHNERSLRQLLIIIVLWTCLYNRI